MSEAPDFADLSIGATAHAMTPAELAAGLGVDPSAGLSAGEAAAGPIDS